MDAPISLERELGHAAEQVVAELVKCWQAKQGSPVAIVYSALVDTYIQGATHKNREENPLPRINPNGWHYATIEVTNRLGERISLAERIAATALPITDDVNFADLMRGVEPQPPVGPGTK